MSCNGSANCDLVCERHIFYRTLHPSNLHSNGILRTYTRIGAGTQGCAPARTHHQNTHNPAQSSASGTRGSTKHYPPTEAQGLSPRCAPELHFARFDPEACLLAFPFDQQNYTQQRWAASECYSLALAVHPGPLPLPSRLHRHLLGCLYSSLALCPGHLRLPSRLHLPVP